MLLFYIRHGDPIYDPDSLTPLGKRQAEALAKRIAVYGIDKIYSSPLNRAYQTAKPLSELTKKEIVKVDFLNEGYAWKYFTIPDETGKRDWVYQQRNMRKVFASDEVFCLGYKWYEYPRFEQYEFKDGVEFFDKNVDEFMNSLGYEHDRTHHTYKAIQKNNERIAVYAHEGIGSIFLSSLLDIPYPSFTAHYAMNHSGMTVIELENSGEDIVPKVLSFSNDSHIYKEGLPAYYCNVTPI